MKLKLVNIGQPGMGQYRAEAGGRPVGFIRHTKASVYRCPVSGEEFGHQRCRPVWVAELANGRTVAVRSRREDAVAMLTEAVARSVGVAR